MLITEFNMFVHIKELNLVTALGNYECKVEQREGGHVARLNYRLGWPRPSPLVDIK